jgi:RimJ/RimL family protein N-acetyltransferase
VELMLTERLEIRLPTEGDRSRFIQLFCDDDFMVFSGALDVGGANRRFDQMLLRARELAFAKQPVIERSTSTIIGYAGVDWLDFDGQRRLEFGYRLIPEMRGRGFATEASRMLLHKATGAFHGQILAVIHSDNRASQNVAQKLGFLFWKRASIDGYPYDIFRLQVEQ